MNQEKLIKLGEKLLEIPNIISEYQESILDLSELYQGVLNDIAKEEALIKASIGQMLDSAGKKLYTNSESRESAFIEATLENVNLNDKKEENSKIQRNIGIKKIKIEALSSEQKNIRAIMYLFSSSIDQ